MMRLCKIVIDHKGKQFHDEIMQNDILLGGALMDMYAYVLKGRIQAREELPSLDVFSLESTNCRCQDMHNKAKVCKHLAFLKCMQQEGIYGPIQETPSFEYFAIRQALLGAEGDVNVQKWDFIS